jgi:hypothetical protein
MWGELQRFKVWADDDTEYTIIEEGHIIKTFDHITGKEVGPGNRRVLKTPDGYKVNRVSEGVYEIETPSGPVIARTRRAGDLGSSAQ